MNKLSDREALTPQRILQKYDEKLTEEQKKLLESTSEELFFVYEQEQSIKISKQAPNYNPPISNPRFTTTSEKTYPSKVNNT
jgi:hypothetical protein